MIIHALVESFLSHRLRTMRKNEAPVSFFTTKKNIFLYKRIICLCILIILFSRFIVVSKYLTYMYKVLKKKFVQNVRSVRIYERKKKEHRSLSYSSNPCNYRTNPAKS